MTPAALLHCDRGQATCISFVDSSKLGVCHDARISGNRVFTGGCPAGPYRLGWCFGSKLHLLINHQGRIMAFKITGGNADDRQPLERITAALRGQ